MATDEDIPNESIQASSDESSQEAAGPDTAKKKAAKKTTKKVTKKKVAKKMAPAPADPAPTESTTPETEAEPMAEETVTSEQHEVSATVPAAVTLTPAQPPSGSGAAVAQWGPIALLALLIVVFRAGDETSSANAAPAPHPAPAKSAPAVVPAGSSSGGLSLPPLTLPGSEKLIEGLSAHPWRQGGLGTGEASVAAPPSAAPAIGAQLGGVQAPAIPPQGRWGMRDPAAGYWGQPVPGGYGQGGYSGMQPMPWGYPYGRPADPYWWAQQQAQIPDVLPPAQK